MQKAVDLLTSPHRMWGGTGDFGMDPHSDSGNTKDGPKTYTHGMAPSSLFPTMAPTKISRRFCGFWRICFYIWCINAGPYR